MIQIYNFVETDKITSERSQLFQKYFIHQHKLSKTRNPLQICNCQWNEFINVWKYKLFCLSEKHKYFDRHARIYHFTIFSRRKAYSRHPSLQPSPWQLSSHTTLRADEPVTAKVSHDELARADERQPRTSLMMWYSGSAER